VKKRNINNKPDFSNKKAIVFIHGWRGNKDSFKSLPSMLKVDNAEWFFPEAPYLIDDNANIRSWSKQNQDGTYDVIKSKLYLDKFLHNILKSYKPENIFFIGFSQGATVCYEFLLNLEFSWGGVFPVAGFFRDWSKGINIHPNQKNTKIFIGHGISDEVIDVSESDKIYNYFLNKNLDCELYKYNGGHKISLNYLRKIKEYIDLK
tara:strand:+ start:368 stop:982 length:615 start_codon:yes stop_codon:yes gene_type:complete